MPDVILTNIPLAWSFAENELPDFNVIVFAEPACALPVSVVEALAVIVIFPVIADGVIENVGL